MKKCLVVFIAVFILSLTVNAELIDGPANIYEKPKGKVLFSLNNLPNVQYKAHDDKWFSVTLTVWFKESDLVNNKIIKKNTKLYDNEGKEIGQVLDLIILDNKDKIQYHNMLQLYSFKLTGYTYKNNFQIHTIEKPKSTSEKFIIFEILRIKF